MPGRAALAPVAWSLIVAAGIGMGCGGASAEPGLTAEFRVTPGQYVPGTLPESDRALGPIVRSIASNNNRAYPGIQNKAIAGTVESQASAIAMGLAGDVGYWIVPSGSEDPTSPPDLTFSTRGAFSRDITPGAHSMIFRAVSLDGVMGPSRAQVVQIVSSPVVPSAPGSFVVSLQWDTPADLDLHVVAPATGSLATQPPAERVEIWSKKRDSLAKRTPSDPPFTDAELAAAARLDFDSNAQCAYDGRNAENIVWAERPPAGHYVVRVDASSLCGAATARWHASATFEGAPVSEAFGQMLDSDTTQPHVTGAGLTVFELDIE